MPVAAIGILPISAHYPSWGFETVRVVNRQLPVLALITPHGDLKLELALMVVVAPGFSLPLMGI